MKWYLFFFALIIQSTISLGQTTITKISPNPSDGIDNFQVFEITFSEKIDPESIQSRIAIKSFDQTIDTEITYSENVFGKGVISIQPISILDYGGFYDLEIQTGILDLDGNPILLENNPLYYKYIVQNDPNFRENLLQFYEETFFTDNLVYSFVNQTNDYELWDGVQISLAQIDYSNEIENLSPLFHNYYSSGQLINSEFVTEINLEGTVYYVLAIESGSVYLVTDISNQLVEDEEIIFKVLFTYQYSHEPIDSRVEEYRSIVRNIKVWYFIQNILVKIRTGAVAFVSSLGDWNSVIKAVAYEYAFDHYSIYTDQLVGKLKTDLLSDLDKAESFEINRNYNAYSYSDAKFSYYINNLIILDKIPNYLYLIDEIWEEDGQLTEQLKAIAVTAASTWSASKIDDKLGAGISNTYELATAAALGSLENTDFYESDNPIGNYNSRHDNDSARYFNSAINSSVKYNLAFIDLTKTYTEETITNLEVLENDIDPKFSFSISNSFSGYQIQVLNESDQIVYNTGFIDESISVVHDYSEGSYTGYDAVSDDVRKSLPLTYGSSYTWKVRYIDTGDDWSAWSDLGSFSIANEEDVFGIQVTSPNLSKYIQGQTINISWSTSLPEGTEYKVQLLKDGVLNSDISNGTTKKSIQWEIPNNQTIDDGYSVKIINTSNEDIYSSSSEFEITESVADYDIAVWDFELDDDYFLPNSSIDFTYKIWNSGDQSVSNVEVQYILRESNSGSIVSSSSETISSTISPSQLLTRSANISAPLSPGFYDIELTVSFELDYKAGNNTVIYKAYVGTSNPYQAYIRGSNGVPVIIGSGNTTNIAGYSVTVSAADGNTARVKVNNGNYEYMPFGEIFFFEGSQFGLIFEGKFDNEVYFTYYTPTSDLEFEPIRFIAEAGKSTKVDYIIEDDDPKQTIKFFEEANNITDQDEVIQNWSLSSKVTSTLFKEGELLIHVPSNASRRVHSFWIEVDGSRFIQNLEVEVIDPIPDFDPQLSRVKMTTGPDRIEEISISAVGLDGFNENIQASIQGLPSGVTGTFTGGDREFGIGESITLNLSINSSFNAYGQYNFDLNLASDTRSKSVSIFLDIVDPSENFLSINSVDYIDTDSKMDSLQISFTSDFSLASSAITQNWQYWNGSNWISIPESQIFNNDNQTPGDHQILWKIPTNLNIPEAKFRMNNKSGVDFFSKEGQVPLVDSDHDYSGITIKNDIIYVLDSDNDYGGAVRVQLYNAITGQYLGYKSISNVSDDDENQLIHAYGYFYVVDVGNDRIARFSEGSSSFSYSGAYNYAEDEDCLVRIGNDLYIFYYEHALDISQLIKLNSNLSKGASTNLEYSNAVRSKSGLHFNDTIWVSDRGSTWYKFGSDYQYHGTQSGISGEGFEYYNKKIYATRGDGLIQIYSAYNPYSFYSESSTFEINSTYPTEFIGVNQINLLEDQDYDTLNIASLFYDLDTEIADLTLEFTGITDGLILAYDTTNSQFSIKPKSNVDIDQSFKITVTDGTNLLTQNFDVHVTPIDDNAIGVITGKTLTINEDNSVKVPFDSLFVDVDSELLDLQFEVSANIDNDPGQLASFTPTVNIESQYLLIQPSPNENGTFGIELEITNLETDSTLTITFSLEVLPVNDAPESFSLISPLNTRIIPGDFDFEWEESTDSEGDEVTYEFILSINNEEFTESVITNSTLFTIEEDMVGKTGFWQVIAKDGTDKKYPTNNYGNFQVVADSSALYPFDQVIKEDISFVIDETTSTGTVFGNVLNYFPSDLDDLDISISDNNNFNINSEGFMSVKNPVDFESQNEYSLDLNVVYAGYEAIAFSSEVAINLNDVNEAPTADDATFSIDENSPVSTSIGTVTTSDPDGDALTFSIVSGNDLGAFQIDENTGEITVADPAPLDFETNPTFEPSVEASDGEFTSTAAITINLNDINEAPSAIDATFSIDENSSVTTVVGTVTASDPDGDDLSFTIISGNDLFGAFQIDQNSGELSVANASSLDFETNPTFSLVIAVSDGELTSTSSITINLNDLKESTNSAPTISDATFSIDENSAVSASVGTVIASDPDRDKLTFSIDSGNDLGAFRINQNTGELKVADPAPLDFETNPTFSLTISVSDGILSDQATISINLNDVDESVNQAPVIANQSFAIDENSPQNFVIGTIQASDSNSDDISFSIISGNDLGAFQIHQNSGELTVADTEPLDFETNPTFNLEVEVSDSELSDTATITVYLNDVDESINHAPVISDQTFTINENSPQNSIIGNIQASDPNGNDLTFSIVSDNDLDTFHVDQNSGELTVADTEPLDFETNPTFSLEVEVSDGELFSSAEVIVKLNDVNEVPIAEDVTFRIDENPPVSTSIGIVTASDPEDDILAFSIISDNDLGAFEIDQNSGELSVEDNEPLDFETNLTFSLQVEVSDGELSDTSDVVIQLNDINEPPYGIELSLIDSIFEDVRIGTAIGLFSTLDPDVTDSFNYSITIDSGHFEINFDTLFTSAEFIIDSDSVLVLEVKVTDKENFPYSEIFEILIINVENSDSLNEDKEVLSIEITHNIEIYPNPVKDILFINWSDFKNATLSDLTGKGVVYSNKNMLDIRELKAGVYILTIESKDQSVHRYRIIKE